MHVLLVNDDGPPSPASPFIFGFYKHLRDTLGVTSLNVVIPSAQKSWIGKAYHIEEIVKGRYYYPREPDGLGETSEVSRPLKDGEIAEWVLLDGTPATCTNIALHNLFPQTTFDLVISGPNFGRNSSAAFTMSSGTIGAAMSSALCGIRSIALSYGIVKHPPPPSYFEPAHNLGSQIIHHLLQNWGIDEGGKRNGEVDLYNINIPIVEGLLSDQGLKVYWTSLWRNSYSRLFKYLNKGEEGTVTTMRDTAGDDQGRASDAPEGLEPPLLFKWAPDVRHIVFPDVSLLPPGTDAWALYHGAASITPLCAAYGEPANHGDSNTLAGNLVEVRL